ncbi:MAG: CPBP family intramembrane metalloprotease [Gemmataceae bacterium]|nr:CPBP family intramembrane metalloprotease [Gemmataceae bacterium]
MAGTPTPAEHPADPAPAPAPTEPSGPTGPVWWEVGAVLAVGVFPHWASVLDTVFRDASRYTRYAASQFIVGACVSFATLYLMARSGRPWAAFGVVRPRLSDLAVGALLVPVVFAIGDVLPPLPDFGRPEGGYAPLPDGAAELALMAVTMLVAALAEELVTRAYLVTRLRELLRSRAQAVVAAAALFASYHAYQGPRGLLFAFAFGVVYGLLFLLLGRVWPLVAGHALYNMILDVGAG